MVQASFAVGQAACRAGLAPVLASAGVAGARSAQRRSSVVWARSWLQRTAGLARLLSEPVFAPVQEPSAGRAAVSRPGFGRAEQVAVGSRQARGLLGPRLASARKAARSPASKRWRERASQGRRVRAGSIRNRAPTALELAALPAGVAAHRSAVVWENAATTNRPAAPKVLARAGLAPAAPPAPADPRRLRFERSRRPSRPAAVSAGAGVRWRPSTRRRCPAQTGRPTPART